MAFHFGAATVFAQSSGAIGPGELNRLISLHLPQKAKENLPSDDIVERRFLIGDAKESAVFRIPGFRSYGCGECHDGEELLEKAADRMRRSFGRLQGLMPEVADIPLRQYIIQSWADQWLKPRQFAHATFDTVRVFPRTVLIDGRVYDNATHIHESLHLAQAFLGQANELEAYALNVRSDPRFLVLNFPYFEDVVRTFYVPDLKEALDEFFARPLKENSLIPREVQWYMDPFDEVALGRIRNAVREMEPLLKEVSRLNRDYPLESAYLSEQTGVPSLLLEIAAAERLTLPEIKVSREVREKALAIMNKQMANADNTRLGRVVDRKKEAFFWIRSQLKLNDPAEELGLYFYYLKRRFIGVDGKAVLKVGDAEDFNAFVDRKLGEVEKMIRTEGITVIEKQAAKKMMVNIQKLKGG